MYDAKAVANEFLDIAAVHRIALSPMKIQKLVYYAHGWHLAITKRPLIDERIEAWKFGPVVPSLYQALKGYGSQAVTDKIVIGDSEDGCIRLREPQVMPAAGTVSSESAFTLDLLKRIWTLYGKFSPIELSEATHRPGTPWHKIRETYGDVKNVDIPDEMIREYFEALAARKSVPTQAP